LVLFGLILVGMLWSPTPFASGGGASHYAKLLLIPITMASDFTNNQARQIGLAFLAGCLVILVLSLVSFFVVLPPPFHSTPGVPLKDNAVQSGCFALSSFGLALIGIHAWRTGNRRGALTAMIFALLFFSDIFLIFFSKTGILGTAALVVLLAVHIGGWRISVSLATAIAIAVLIGLWWSPQARARLTEVLTDIRSVRTQTEESEPTLSTASRIDFWRKAVEFIEEAPLFGHGTGSTKFLYQSLEATRPSPYGEAVPDPHNQFFAITIQVGLVGGMLLLVMWSVHFFAVLGRDPTSAIGQAIVIQNFVGSLFNSHLSTVTQGTLYCLAIGLLAGLLKRSQISSLTSSE
jgi:O-antigen ligase